MKQTRLTGGGDVLGIVQEVENFIILTSGIKHT